MIYDNRVLGVDLPNTVELTVVETEPGIKGDTATGGSKNATMDTGYVVKVPLFINEGDVLAIDTCLRQFFLYAYVLILYTEFVQNLQK